VKHSLRWAVLAAVVLSLGYPFSLAVAQAPARPAGGANIALLDVTYIFKNHARFKRMMEDMKADVERAEQQVKKDKDELTKLAEKLQEFNKGTQNYQQLEEEMAKRQADLQVRVQLQKNQFLQQEATIYHNVYQEVLQATEYYCKQNNIDMVYKFSGDQVDVNRPDSVLSFINKPVVWYQKNLDITPAILQELNRTAIDPRAAQPAQRPAVPFNR
jgi:Skp family chaperone for outer membrane proteins